PDAFLGLIGQIRAAAPRAGIRSNVICGFPGETDADLTVLHDFLVAAELDAVGVFGYSDEDGTEAENLGDKLDADTIGARVARISALVEELTTQRAEDRIGSEVVVLIEREESEDEDCSGRAAHQAPEVDGECVVVDGETGPAVEDLVVGDLVRCRVIDSEGVDLVVEPVAVIPRAAVASP
ncbi:MAG: 30S ribosomal protein S12 methylthiotransferase RimO, partial [Actinokineospora sp.]